MSSIKPIVGTAKRIGAIAAIVLVSGCDSSVLCPTLSRQVQQEQQTKDAALKWVWVDPYKIKGRLKEIAAMQNPYPAEYNHDKVQLKSDMEAAIKQDDIVKDVAWAKCEVPGQEKQRGSRKESRLINSAAFKSGPDGSFVRFNPGYDDACLQKVPQDPLVMEAGAALQKLKAVENRQKLHDKSIEAAANQKYKELVAAYASKAGFDLVIDKNDAPIYNKSNQSVDVTDGVLSTISPDMTTIKVVPNQPGNVD